jgi:hypothetical protein
MGFSGLLRAETEIPLALHLQFSLIALLYIGKVLVKDKECFVVIWVNLALAIYKKLKVIAKLFADI